MEPITSNIKLWFMKGFKAGKHVQTLEHAHKEVDGRGVWNAIESKLTIKDINLTDMNGTELKYNEN